MRVIVYATLRRILGCRELDLDLPPGATVRQLLDAACERHPALRAELFNEKGALWPHVHVFVNGRDAPYLDGALDTPLGDGDTVDLFPAVAGG